MKSRRECGIILMLMFGGLMEKGLRHIERMTVTGEDTACAMGSGTLQVFSTPTMIALMEKTCYSAVQPYLDEGITTVGTLVDIEHLSATPVGMEVEAECILEEIDGRRLVFSVEARDETGVIGRGKHERFTVKRESFQKKADAKLEK